MIPPLNGSPNELTLDFTGEKRRFQRLLVTLPVEFGAFHPESGEYHDGQGVLKDFSLSGVYFHSREPIPFKPGYILTISISTPLPPLSQFDHTHIQVRGEIMRLEGPFPENGHYGVAVNFLEFPSFANLAHQVTLNG